MHLYKQVTSLSLQWSLQPIFRIQTVDGLSACNRPCAIALTALFKTSLMFGDLPPLTSGEPILKLCQQYHLSIDGTIPRQERPGILQKSILARIPPPTQQ